MRTNGGYAYDNLRPRQQARLKARAERKLDMAILGELERTHRARVRRAIARALDAGWLSFAEIAEELGVGIGVVTRTAAWLGFKQEPRW